MRFLRSQQQRRSTIESPTERRGPTFWHRRLPPGIGVAVLAIIAALALAAPLFPGDPFRQDLGNAFAAPSFHHPFGTDNLGRDIAIRVAYGGRLSLVSAAIASLLAATLGVLVGLVSGFVGGLVDAVLMRFVDLLLSLPGILLALAIVAILGAGPSAVILSISVVSVPIFARLVRARTLEIVGEEYVTAARAGGATNTYLMFRTILPNTTSVIIVQFTITAATAILLESALSFLGLGAQPPAPSWGSMLAESRSYLNASIWYALFPGIALTLTVLALDSLGRRLQRAVGLRGGMTEVRRGA